MAIENANSSGQGHDAEHVNHPLYSTVVKHGYVYSHSTPIHTIDGATYIHHTYKLGTHNVGLNRGESWNTSICSSSGRHWSGKGTARLDAHLKSKRKRYYELRYAIEHTDPKQIQRIIRERT